MPRVRGVRFTLGHRITGARPVDGRLGLTLDDGSTRRVDHAFLATGYRVDIAGYPFLSAELARSVRSRNGYPELGAGFESSVPGLHFLGAPAASSFGPILRFVCGTWYASRVLSQALVARSGGGQVSAVALMEPAPGND
jgi:hypothetical protein